MVGSVSLDTVRSGPTSRLRARLLFDSLFSNYPDQGIGGPGWPYAPEELFFPAGSTPGYEWKDISPRVGIAYDLFGNGKTALRFNVGKYLEAITASNNDLDMFEAMRQAAFQQKLVTMDPTAISAADAIEMATLGGARALGRNKLGSIAPGMLADIIVVDLSRARQQPVFDAVSQIVYASRGDDVVTTIVNGRILMRDRKVLTLNEANVIAEARKAADLVRRAVQ